jgi:mono/diheme cytochrome c family protein
MKHLFRAAGITLLVIAVLLVGAKILNLWRPIFRPRARPLTSRTFERTPQRLERGRYLATSLLGCIDCHSVRDWAQHDAPIVNGMMGAGDIFPAKGLPGRVVAQNLTPDPETGVGTWTDDQLARAIREGIGHDGRVLFPLMPFTNYRRLSDEDLASVIVFLRSLPPVRHPLPKTELVFPVKYLIRTVPQPLTEPVPPPHLSTPEKRGEFLATVGGCGDCHTPKRTGDPIPGLKLAGGEIFEGPWGRAATANLTLDPSGISYYDERFFVHVMRTGFVQARELSPIMPWWSYRNLTDDDLKSIFAYLRTLKPVKHRGDNLAPPTLCKICGNMHGLGNQN